MKKRIIACLLILLLIPCSVFAHSGKTDSQGGHRDKNNVSGLGSYHYHHGYGPHLHPNGVCPYSYDSLKNNSSGGSSSRTEKELADLQLLYDNLRDYTDKVEISEMEYAHKAKYWETSCYYALGGCGVLFIGLMVMTRSRNKYKKMADKPSLPPVTIPDIPNTPIKQETPRPLLVRVSDKGKYHFPGCEYYPIRGKSMPIEEAIAKGYKPCKVCCSKRPK